MRYWVLFLMIVAISCKITKKTEGTPEERAINLSQKFIIADGHIDLPYRLRIQNFRLEKEFIGIPISSKEGDFDYERAIEGGLDAPFMSIFIPSYLQKEEGASKIMADSLIDMVKGIIKAHPLQFAAASTPADVQRNFERAIVSLPMGMENGSPIGSDLTNVKYFRERGISYITLCHSKDNQICDSSYDTTRTWKGLSPFGEEVVKEMNRQGIMVDVSHISDQSFWDVMELTKVPVIASHSSCRKFTPGFERNMSDEMLRALGKNGGVIMINFGSSFIDKKVKASFDSLRLIWKAEMDSLNVEPGSNHERTLRDKYFKNNPALWSDITVVADHIDHAVKVAGIDHVGFGSDFDGVGDSLPRGLKDVSDYPQLIKELINRGYSEEDIEKLCYLNLRRVWNKTLEAAI